MNSIDQLSRKIYMASLVVVVLSCKQQAPEDLMYSILVSMPESYREIVNNPGKYRFQVLYTRIDRDSANRPLLYTLPYNLNNALYFYPASTVKLPVAVMALEKINGLNVPGLSKGSFMLTDSAYSGQTKVSFDSTSGSLRPSVEHYIKKIFLVSDNDAFNRLYEFLGQEYINNSLASRGFPNTGIVHRLSIFLSSDENRHTNPIRFYSADTLVYAQPPLKSPELYKERKPILLGQGYMQGDSLVHRPMDFAGKNFMSLEDLHRFLTEVIFPGSLNQKPLFNLANEDYDLLYRYMSMYPRESEDPHYGDKYTDNYCKFLMYGNYFDQIPDHIRIFNKVGVAYGFVIDAAYIVDFENKVEFFLSAVIDVNLNQVYGDNRYAYDSLGFPLFEELGNAFYNYELNRKKAYVPDLDRFIFDYN